MVAAVKSGEMDIIALSTEEYLQAEGSLRCEPAFTYLQSGQVELEYVILARQDSSCKGATDLRGKRIAAVKGGRSSMIPLWLDSYLFDNGMPPKESFFREIKEVSKASQAILPVFFKQIDLGVVCKSAFEAAATLNPQIGRQLRIVANSPRLVPMVTCLNIAIRPERRKELLDQALRLHENPKGLQSFNVFKLERLVRWEPRYLDATKDLLKKQKLAMTAHQAQLRPISTLTEERQK
jgi:ABC-type phosphate/phosphonate transport system substrate-binding protein